MPLLLRLCLALSALTAGACTTGGAVVLPGEGVTLPVLVTSVRPYYTQEALASWIEGRVLLTCVLRDPMERLATCRCSGRSIQPWGSR